MALWAYGEQFRWVKSRLPNQAQPVPPIFQPEVGARAVVWAARHPRKELYVGWPTVKAIVGDKLVSSFADHYLARMGYEGQQTDEPRDPERPDNLWEPVAGDQAAHGVFDARAQGWSAQLWLATHRGWVAAGGAGLAALAAALLWRRAAQRGSSDGRTTPGRGDQPDLVAARGHLRDLPALLSGR